MFVFRKNLVIQEKIGAYLTVVNETLDCYAQGMEHYLEHHFDDHFKVLLEEAHGRESAADDLRREIEAELFAKSLLPEVREDLMRLLELMDRIPNCAHKTLLRIYTHDIILPAELTGKARELTRLGVANCRRLKDGVLDILGPCAVINELARNIRLEERVADRLEHEFLYDIFHGPYEPVNRLLYRELCNWLAHLPDLAETVVESLVIFALKRHA